MSEILESCAAVSASCDVFSAVRDPECNLAIWERETSSSFANLLSDGLDDVRFEASLSHLRDRLEQALSDAGYVNQIERDELIADIVILAGHYCSVLSLSDLEVRLEVVTTNSCRKWHADYVKARLITTYVGSGTQWLNSADSDRVKNAAEPVRINSMSAGDVGIFKGKLATTNAAIHRSPPIAGTGEKRLLLVLNPTEGN